MPPSSSEKRTPHYLAVFAEIIPLVPVLPSLNLGKAQVIVAFPAALGRAYGRTSNGKCIETILTDH